MLKSILNIDSKTTTQGNSQLISEKKTTYYYLHELMKLRYYRTASEWNLKHLWEWELSPVSHVINLSIGYAILIHLFDYVNKKEKIKEKRKDKRKAKIGQYG